MPSRFSAAREQAAAQLPSAATVLVAVAAGAAGLAGSYAVAGFTPGFLTAPVATVLTNRMPAAVVTFAILVLGDLGKLLNLAAALAVSVLLLAGTALLGITAGRRARVSAFAPVVGGVSSLVVSLVVTGAVTPSLAAGAGVAAVLAVAAVAGTVGSPRGVSSDRRRVLGSVAAALSLSAGGFLAGDRTTTATQATLAVDDAVLDEASSLLAEADEKSMGVDGIEPLVSERFYNVDIANVDPNPDTDSWTLTVTGDVEEELTYDYDDITAMDAENRFVSLRCVGESLNGKKLDNALWQGVPIRDLVDPAGVPDNCCVMLRAADGFYEEFPLPALDDGFLAFGMNGEVLPRSHGYPARALIPGHWGEINVKWLTEIEVLQTEQDGYWEKRGWHGTGPVETVAKLHATNVLDDGRVQVAGHAYAGTRGIDRVEVSTDGGETWTDAILSDPLPGDDVWRQWTHEYDAPGERHDVVVRAVDGNGDLQPEEETDAYPSGPTGWVSKTIDA